jgi:hypothetical protein
MRGIIILTAAFVIGLSPIIGGSSEVYGPVPTIPLSLNGSDWQRVDPGAWETTSFDGKTTGYRIDRKSDGSLDLYYSVDGFKWEQKKDQVWQDGEGNHFRIVHNNIVFSDDGGISWTELRHCVWQDPQGRWLMLDREGRLWRMKDDQRMDESIRD